MVNETFDISFITSIIPKLIEALPVTLRITGLSLLFGWIIGLIVTFGKVSRHRILALILDKITVVLRGIPTVVLLYLAYFGLPGLIQAVSGVNISKWSKEVFCIIALATELTVSSSEMFRSAYNSLDKGQLEAAHSIGMTRVQRFFRVIVPQGVYVILPNLGSATLSIIQGTALVYTLGIIDIMGRARVLDTNAFGLKTFEAYFTVALFYWAISLAVTAVFHLLERYFGRGIRSVGTAK